MARPVYVVRCVDTEGPLHESVEAAFERLKGIFGIELEPIDEETYPVGALDAIGLAANNAYGVTTVVNVNPATGAASRRVLNDPSAAVAASQVS